MQPTPMPGSEHSDTETTAEAATIEEAPEATEATAEAPTADTDASVEAAAAVEAEVPVGYFVYEVPTVNWKDAQSRSPPSVRCRESPGR